MTKVLLRDKPAQANVLIVSRVGDLSAALRALANRLDQTGTLEVALKSGVDDIHLTGAVMIRGKGNDYAFIAIVAEDV